MLVWKWKAIRQGQMRTTGRARRTAIAKRWRNWCGMAAYVWGKDCEEAFMWWCEHLKICMVRKDRKVFKVRFHDGAGLISPAFMKKLGSDEVYG